MSAMAMRNTDYGNENIQEFKPSSLTQRIRALESAGMSDTFIKKRIPAYAAEAATVASEISKTPRNFQIGNSTKIYQNPSNHFEHTKPNAANISINSISSVHSNNSQTDNNKIYRSNSVDSIENSDNTFNENPDIIVHEDRGIASPVNYHHIITELNEAKNNLKKVPEPPISPLVERRLGKVVDNTTNVDQNQPLPNVFSHNFQDTSFSKATSKLLAESLGKNSIYSTTNVNNHNESSNSINQIPISIPLNGSSIPSNLSRSSTPGAIASLVNIFQDVNNHNSHSEASKPIESSRSLVNIFDPNFNNSKNPENTQTNRSDYIYNKHTSPRPYQNPLGSISSLKNIAQEVFEHKKHDTNMENDNISVRSNANSIHSVRSSVSSHQLHQPFTNASYRSSINSHDSIDKPYVSSYTARNTNLLTKAPASMTSSSTDLLNATPFRAQSFEQLDSNDYFSGVKPTYTSRKAHTPSLYDEYLINNQSYGSNINNRSSSVSSSNNTLTGNQKFSEFNGSDRIERASEQNLSRSHLVSDAYVEKKFDYWIGRRVKFSLKSLKFLFFLSFPLKFLKHSDNRSC